MEVAVTVEVTLAEQDNHVVLACTRTRPLNSSTISANRCVPLDANAAVRCFTRVCRRSACLRILALVDDDVMRHPRPSGASSAPAVHSSAWSFHFPSMRGCLASCTWLRLPRTGGDEKRAHFDSKRKVDAQWDRTNMMQSLTQMYNK